MKSSYRHVEQHDQPYVKPVLSSTGFRAETLLDNPKRQNCQVFETIFVKLTHTNTIPINYHEKIPPRVCISKLKATRHFTWSVANQGSMLIKIFTA